MRKIIAFVSAISFLMPCYALAESSNNSVTGDDGNIYQYHVNSFGAAIDKITLENEDGEINIPNELGGASVYIVSEYAFSSDDKERVKSIIVPTGVDKMAFRGMENLKSVQLPSDLSEISNHCFFGCVSLEEISLPDGLQKIGAGAFADCSSIESIQIPESVIQIDEEAFSGCTSLYSIKWNDDADLGANVFKGTKFLSESEDDFILIKNGTVLYSYAGKNKTVEIPETVKEICQFAFEGSSAEKIIYPQALDKITQNAFFGAEKLKEIEFKGEISEIGECAFMNCFSLEEAIIPDDTEKISYGCFSGCSAIKTVHIPNGVTEIEQYAFSYCDGIEALTFDEHSVKTIDACAFERCVALKQLTLPDSLQKIGESAFNGCSKLSELIVNSDVTIEDEAFCNTALEESNILFNGDVIYTPVSRNKRYKNDPLSFLYGDKSAEKTAEPTVIPTDEPTEPPTEKPTEESEPTVEPTEQPTSKPLEQSILTVTSTGNSLTVATDGKEVDFGEELPFIDENGRTQIPIRAVAEALGCEVSWDEEIYTATLTKGENVVTIKIGSAEMQSGSEIITMDTTAQIINDRTYIPVRFAGEALGLKVEWVNE